MFTSDIVRISRHACSLLVHTHSYHIYMWGIQRAIQNDKVEMIIVIPRPLISSCFQHYWAIFLLLFFSVSLGISKSYTTAHRDNGRPDSCRWFVSIYFDFFLSFHSLHNGQYCHTQGSRREWIDNRILEGPRVVDVDKYTHRCPPHRRPPSRTHLKTCSRKWNQEKNRKNYEGVRRVEGNSSQTVPPDQSSVAHPGHRTKGSSEGEANISVYGK